MKRHLDHGEVHVWHASLLTAPTELERLTGLLSAAERQRAMRLRSEADRQRFMMSRGILRRLLGWYLGADPASFVLEAGEHGKPRLADTSQRWLGFNLAHSGDLALVALARDREVGVDVEQIAANLDVEGIARRHLTPAERRWVSAAPVGRQAAALLELWTRKEAVLKGLGAGLSIPPERVDVLPWHPVWVPGAGPWWLAAVAAGHGYAAATAVAGERPAVVRSGWIEPIGSAEPDEDLGRADPRSGHDHEVLAYKRDVAQLAVRGSPLR